jgi:hypothetical protein
MYEAALAVKVVQSKQCLFYYTFSNSNRESTSVGLQSTETDHVYAQNVGHDANVRTMAAPFGDDVVETKAMLVARVVSISRFDGPKRVHLT